MSAPTANLTWGTDGSADIAEPSSGQKGIGFVHGEKAPAHWINWWMNGVYQWIAYYGTKDAASGLVGLDANIKAAVTSTTGDAITGVSGGGNGAGLKGTGNGTGSGLVGVGGGTSGAGVTGTGGASNGKGVVGAGTGTGTGVEGTGGGSNGVGVKGIATGTGAGVEGVGGISNGVKGTSGSASGSAGVYGIAAASGAYGVYASGGTGNQFALKVAKGSTATDAIDTDGNIDFTGSNPSATTGFSNRLTPLNLPKCWGNLLGQGGSAPTVNDGFNLGTCSSIGGGNQIRVAFATAMADANYAVIPAVSSIYYWYVVTQSASQFDLAVIDIVTNNPVSTNSIPLAFTVFGRQ